MDKNTRLFKFPWLQIVLWWVSAFHSALCRGAPYREIGVAESSSRSQPVDFIHKERESVTRSSGMLMQRIWFRLPGSRQFGDVRSVEGTHRDQDPACLELSQADIYGSGTTTIAGTGEQRPDGGFCLFSTKAKANRLPAGDDRENHSYF